MEFGLSSPAGTSSLAERLPAAAIARLTAAIFTLAHVRAPWLSVLLLRDLVLLQLLIQITSRRIDHFRRFRDVPTIFSQFGHEIGAFGAGLEFLERRRG